MGPALEEELVTTGERLGSLAWPGGIVGPQKWQMKEHNKQ